MNGNVLFNNSNCQFYFDGNKLKIYANNGEATEILTEALAKGVESRVKKPLLESKIEGYSYDDKCSVIFYVHQTGYGYSFNSVDSARAILTINVKKYLFKKKNVVKRSDKTIIHFQSHQFGNFLGLIPNYVYSNSDDNLAKITYNSSIKKQVGLFKYKGIECQAIPCPRFTVGLDLFNFTPSLYIEVSAILPIDDVLNLIGIWMDILSFFHMRRNIIPDLIEYESDEYKYQLFIVKQLDYFEENKYKNDLTNPTCIMWNAIFQNFNNIFDDFTNHNVYLNFIENNIFDRQFVSFERISRDGAFFENTFKLIYSDFKIVHRPVKQEIINEITELLVSEKENAPKDKKDIIDYLLNQLKHVTLSTKILQVLKDYKECCRFTKESLSLLKESDSVIAETCANMRNWIDHGDEKANIDIFVAKCFALLRAATYSMLLKKWGIDETVISIQVRNLVLFY